MQRPAVRAMRQFVARTLMALAGACLICGAIRGEEKEAPGNVMPMDLDEYCLNVPVFFWEQWRSFILDTGAAITLLHSNFTNHLSRVSEFSWQTVHGPSAPLPYFKGIPIFVGGFWAYPESIAASDMRPLEELTGTTIDGILGENVLQDYIITLNFETEKISFETNLPIPVQIGLPFKHGTNGYRCLPASLANGVEIELGVDTGFASEIMLNPTDWDKAFPKGPENSVSFKSANFEGKVSESIQARLPLIKIGSESYTNLICDRLVNTNLPSQLGLDFLRDHRVTIDYPHDRVNFVRTRARVARGVTAGMGIKWIRGSAVIFHIHPDGAAQLAGLQEGDEILRIRGQQIGDIKRKQVYELLRGNEGDVVKVFVMRGDEPMTVQLRLKKEL
jgi:hypothetical protein